MKVDLFDHEIDLIIEAVEAYENDLSKLIVGRDSPEEKLCQDYQSLLKKLGARLWNGETK